MYVWTCAAVRVQVKLQCAAGLSVGQLVAQYISHQDASLPRQELQAMDVALKQEIIEELVVKAMEPRPAGGGGAGARQYIGRVLGKGIYWNDKCVTLGPTAEVRRESGMGSHMHEKFVLYDR